MSAFICQPEHIGLLAAYAAKLQPSVIHECSDPSAVQAAKNVAELLAKENIRSVAHRYPNDRDGQRPGPANLYDNEIVEAAKLWADHYYFHFPAKATPVVILQLSQCLEYQSCETDDWASTLACRQVEWIKGKAIRELPGYDDAPYEWLEQDETTPPRIQAFYEEIDNREAA